MIAPDGPHVTTLLEGLAFPEAPRWHDGALWFSDIFGREVGRVELGGRHTTVVRLDDQPSGLGWLPDGTLLVVAMQQRRVLRLDAGGSFEQYADLTPFALWPANDMLVSVDGVAYVGHFGFDRQHGTTPRMPASLLRVMPGGAVDVAAPDLQFPNGMAVRTSGDGRPAVLVVAESGAGRLTEFDIGPDGELSGRRTLAEVPVAPGAASANPDGICLDPSGAVWVPDTIGRRVLLLGAGGTVTAVLELGGRIPLACEIVGDGRDLLAVCSVADFSTAEDAVDRRTGRIDLVHLDQLES